RLFRLENADSLKGKTDADFFAREHAERALRDEQEVMRTGVPVIGKLEKEVHQDGRVTWALTNKQPWRNEAGEVVGIFGISKDITALKQAEEKLAAEQQLLRSLLDNIPDCIYFKDINSRFVHVSESKTQKALAHFPGLRDVSAAS